jgi:hypothetical protein
MDLLYQNLCSVSKGCPHVLDLDVGQPATQIARSGQAKSPIIYKIRSSFCHFCIRDGAAYPANVDITGLISAHWVRAKHAIKAPMIGRAAKLIM